VNRAGERDSNGDFIKDLHVEDLTALWILAVWVGPPGNLTYHSWYHKIVTTEKCRDSGIYVQDYTDFGASYGASVPYYQIFIKK